MRNYDIEMWRYARELKVLSDNSTLGHEHIRNTSAILQSVNIRTNEWGLRGGIVPPVSVSGGRRILFLGSSITLGWGVTEEETLTSRLQEKFAQRGEEVIVLNAGVGNYNAERFAELFFTKLKELEPTDIVVQYFLRDAEKLETGGGNWLLRNSQLAVTVWIAANRLFKNTGEESLVDHYREVYQPDQPGYLTMKRSLRNISEYSKSKGIRLFLAMTPDVHNLKNYEFQFVHDKMENIATDLNYRYIDLLPAFGALTSKDVWAMPGDPHPNSLGHELMAEAIFAFLADAN